MMDRGDANSRLLGLVSVGQHDHWYKNWSYINSCISDFVSNSYNQDVFIVGCTIRELFLEEKNIVYLICMNWKNL